MPTIVSFDGQNYAIPSSGEVGWGDQVSSFLIAVAQNTLVSGATVEELIIESLTTTTQTDEQFAVTVAEADTLDPVGTNIILTALDNITLNTTTAIDDGEENGQLLTLTGTSDTNTITIQDGANTRLNGDVILGNGETITLKWDATRKWVEVNRSV